MSAPKPPREKASQELITQWLALSRKVLKTCYPDSPYATLVVPQPDGIPDFVLPVTPLPRPSRKRSPRPS
jgi:hypothetical protein